jgi:hypothetical protein
MGQSYLAIVGRCRLRVRSALGRGLPPRGFERFRNPLPAPGAVRFQVHNEFLPKVILLLGALALAPPMSGISSLNARNRH